MARPSGFKREYIDQARKIALLGATDMQLADIFGVDTRTIYRWKNEIPEFCQSLKIGKEEADQQVVRSLYHRAVGFEYEAVKIFCSKDGKVTQVPYIEKVPPDTTACIFWLKNRNKAEWRDKIEQEVTGANGGPIQSEVSIKFVKTGENSV